MSPIEHKIETLWREADATALEERVRAMEEWLEHTEDLGEMFGEDDDLTTELLSTAGLVKARRNDVSQEADRTRSLIMDRKK